MKPGGWRRATFIVALVACGLGAWRLGADSRRAADHAGTARPAPPGETGRARDRSRGAGGDSDPLTAVPLHGFRASAAKHDLPADCVGGEMRRANSLLAALDPAYSAEDAFAHALLSQIYVQGDGRDPDGERRATSRMQAGWQAARRRWPASIDIAWQAARQCSGAYGCDEAGAERHLLALDADNAAAWLLAMEGASRRGQHALYDTYLVRAAKATRYAPPSGAMYRVLEPAFAAAPVPMHCMSQRGLERRAARLGHLPTIDDLAGEMARLLEEALNTFDPGAAFAGCRSNFIPVPDYRRSNCAVVLAMVAEGATMGERETALPLLIPLLGDSSSGLEYRERYRRLLYLETIVEATRERNVLSDTVLPSNDFEAWRQIAVAQQHWPPPRNWLPEWPLHRSLILHGKFVTPAAHD